MTPRLLMRVLGVGGALGLIAVALVAVQKYRAERQLFFPAQRPTQLPAASSGIPGARDITIDPSGVALRGWYAPGTNRALVIFCHGAGANRSQFGDEARALTAAGFGVLLFDWPGQGESPGSIHWNEGERAALRRVIAWAEALQEIERTRIGAYGFSMGGYTLSQVAAEDSRLAAIVLASTPADQREQIHYQYGRLGPLGEWPARYALRRGGMQIELRKPIDEVKKITPRPILSLGGSGDFLVAPSMAHDLANAAAQPNSVYIVAGALHGNYVLAGGTVYLERVVSFFRGALLTRPS